MIKTAGALKILRILAHTLRLCARSTQVCTRYNFYRGMDINTYGAWNGLTYRSGQKAERLVLPALSTTKKDPSVPNSIRPMLIKS
jgi:hypothetical protein